MRLIKRAGHWSVKYKDAAGKWQRFATGLPVTASREDATRVATSKLQALLNGTSPVRERNVGAVFNVAEALERCYLTRWQGTASDVQLKYVVRTMEREVGHWLLTDIPGSSGYARIKAYRDGLVKDGKSKATANRRLSILKVALKEAHREGHLSAMPAFPETLAEDNVRERYLTPEEEASVRDYLQRQVGHSLLDSKSEWPYIAALFDFLLDTGCRLSEALDMDRSNAVASGALVTAIHLKHGTTKSGRGRLIPLTPRASAACLAMLASPLHGKVSVDWVGHRWGLVRRECGIEDVNIHILRHSCASRLLARGVDLYTVSKWLGHSSVKVTERYAHLQAGALEQAAAALAGGPVAVVHRSHNRTASGM